MMTISSMIRYIREAATRAVGRRAYGELPEHASHFSPRLRALKQVATNRIRTVEYYINHYRCRATMIAEHPVATATARQTFSSFPDIAKRSHLKWPLQSS